MIEFEHTIFLLLLLSGILNAKPPKQRLGVFVVLAGFILVFLAPSIDIQIPWEIILGLVLPLLLWQNIRRIITADWRGWPSFILFLFSVLIFSAALWLIGDFAWTETLLFGLIVSSMIWRAGEPESGASYLSQLGALTLVFLLTEVDLAIQSPNQYIGGIFSAAFIGFLSALFGLYLLQKVSKKYHSWIYIGQVYFAYWFSFFVGVSAVTGALVCIMAFVWISQYNQQKYNIEKLPAPMNHWPGFTFVLILFLLLGWQAHEPISILLLAEVIVGTLIGLGILWLGNKIENPDFWNNRTFWLAGLRVATLLFPVLLIWPRDILDEPILLLIAIGIAIFVIGLSYLVLSFYFPKKAHSRIFPPQD
ncbi:MAG: hypothetical protein HON98_10960 [Chloroflexi bacterium]|jgi:hypothetical protein|nr:hypothetical protein [Chloroflexota bacterium]